tara:strand:- start:694 stop:1221 length:528 start_codon:yes stop_codon:yes gene_type:complete
MCTPLGHNVPGLVCEWLRHYIANEPFHVTPLNKVLDVMSLPLLIILAFGSTPAFAHEYDDWFEKEVRLTFYQSSCEEIKGDYSVSSNVTIEDDRYEAIFRIPLNCAYSLERPTFNIGTAGITLGASTNSEYSAGCLCGRLVKYTFVLDRLEEHGYKKLFFTIDGAVMAHTDIPER